MAGIEFPENWHGAEPFCLIVVQGEEAIVQDLEEPGYIAAKGDQLFRQPGTLYLCRKEDRSITFGIKLLADEQGYAKSRVIGAVVPGSDMQGQVRVWGIGAKRRDGHTDSLWILPSGLVCAGDDVELFAREQMVIG